MLTRPGSKPGPAWMRNFNVSLADPNRGRRVIMPFWPFFVYYLLWIVGLTHFVTLE